MIGRSGIGMPGVSESQIVESEEQFEIAKVQLGDKKYKEAI